MPAFCFIAFCVCQTVSLLALDILSMASLFSFKKGRADLYKLLVLELRFEQMQHIPLALFGLPSLNSLTRS